MTIQGFVSSARHTLDTDSALNFQRTVQRSMFEEIWRRARRGVETPVERTYATVGQLTQGLFSFKPTLKSLRTALMDRPYIGHLKAKQSFHNDIRFVVVPCGVDLFLLMDNSAIDSRMPTVMKLDRELETFVEHDQGLLDFVLLNDLRV